METKVYSYPIKILEHHLDAYGHVNNVAYIGFFEQARWDMITARGCGLGYVKSSSTGPVVLEIQCKFRRELVLRQDVVIKSFLESWRGKVGIMKQVIQDDQDQIYCEAEIKFGVFDLNLRKLITPSAQWQHALGLSLV